MKTNVAGGVVINTDGDVLVVSQNGDSWSLPKGHVDPGETAQAAAEREIAEESGITETVCIKELGTYERYRIGKGGVGDDTSELKAITVFLFTTAQQDLAPTDPRNPEARWVRLEAVPDLLTHPRDKEFFQSITPLLETYLKEVLDA